jgi:transposase
LNGLLDGARSSALDITDPNPPKWLSGGDPFWDARSSGRLSPTLFLVLLRSYHRVSGRSPRADLPHKHLAGSAECHEIQPLPFWNDKFNRKQLLVYNVNIPASLIGLEACSGAHFLGRALRKQGHVVRLIPAQFVKPFVKSNKNDFIDAEAIAEAVERKNMRFVPIRTDDQLDLQGKQRQDRLSLTYLRPY